MEVEEEEDEKEEEEEESIFSVNEAMAFPTSASIFAPSANFIASINNDLFTFVELSLLLLLLLLLLSPTSQ